MPALSVLRVSTPCNISGAVEQWKQVKDTLMAISGIELFGNFGHAGPPCEAFTVSFQNTEAGD